MPKVTPRISAFTPLVGGHGSSVFVDLSVVEPSRSMYSCPFFAIGGDDLGNFLRPLGETPQRLQ